MRAFLSLQLRFTLHKKVGVVYQKFLIDLQEDVCGFLRGKKPSKILEMVVPVIENYTNTLHECPYHDEVYLKKFRLTSLGLPIVPTGQYRLDVSFYSGKKFLLLAQIYVRIRSNGAYNL